MKENNFKNELRNIIDKDVLTDNMVFISLFITIYENMIDVIVERVKSFLCDIEIKNGEIILLKTQNYKDNIKNKIVDKKGNKDILKATMLWYKEFGAIDDADYESFLKLKSIRNNYVHNLYSVLSDGLFEKDVELFIELLQLYKKIDIWWINEIEIPLLGEVLNDYDTNGVALFDRIIIQIIVDVLYGENEEKYKEILDKVILGE